MWDIGIKFFFKKYFVFPKTFVYLYILITDEELDLHTTQSL